MTPACLIVVCALVAGSPVRCASNGTEIFEFETSSHATCRLAFHCLKALPLPKTRVVSFTLSLPPEFAGTDAPVRAKSLRTLPDLSKCFEVT